jgi:hypothetical protein
MKQQMCTPPCRGLSNKANKEIDYFWLACHNDCPMQWHLATPLIYIAQYFMFMDVNGEIINIGCAKHWERPIKVGMVFNGKLSWWDHHGPQCTWPSTIVVEILGSFKCVVMNVVRDKKICCWCCPRIFFRFHTHIIG